MLVKTSTVHKTTWNELKTAVEEGYIKDLLHNEDQISVDLKNGKTLVFDVTFDENGKLFFALNNCLDDEHSMNNRPTNAGAWKACDMRKYLNEVVFFLLPDELQSVIKPTKITQIVNGERVETEDKLFLFSKTQVFGKGSWSKNEPDDVPLDIFRTERSRVKECGGHGTWWWWLRSPEASSSSAFAAVYIGGNSNTGYASSTYGVAFGFCI